MSEVLQTKLEAHIQASDGKFLEMAAWKKEVSDQFLAFDIKLETKISSQQFLWILAAQITILIAMFGWISVQMDAIRNDGAQVKNQVSYIDGVFKNYDLKINK